MRCEAMDRPDERGRHESPSEWARRSRRRQGLPAAIVDTAACADIATIVRAGLRASDPPDRDQTIGLEALPHPRARDVDAVQDREQDAPSLLERELRPRGAQVRTAPKEVA
jgi:hypothetical protein